MTLVLVEDEQNLIILGKCGTGKTSFAVVLCEKALENNIKVFYTTIEEFIIVLRQREQMPKVDNLFRYMRESSIIVVDDMFYSDIMREEAQLLYRGIAFLNETRSIVIISNREISAWIDASDDKHLMQTMQDRLAVNSQIMS